MTKRINLSSRRASKIRRPLSPGITRNNKNSSFLGRKLGALAPRASLVFLICGLIFMIKTASVLAQSSTAQLILSPASGTVAPDSSFDVGIFLNTQGAQVDGMDAKLIYEPARLEVQSISPNLEVFPNYPTKTTNATTGQITIQGTAPANSPFSAAGPVQVATLRLRALSEGKAILRFDFTRGATTDSNVAEHSTNLDILTSVTNATYTVSPSATGTPPPVGSDLPSGATLTPTLFLTIAAAILLGSGIWRLRRT